MATSSEQSPASVGEELSRRPWKFEFFQAVRLVERLWNERFPGGGAPIGQDGPLDRESVRFRALPSHTFPPGAVSSLKGLEDLLQAPSGARPESSREMVVPFLGLFGPAGVLPRHYTQLVIDRIRRKDFALRDFLDLVNHRATSFFYRAWEKYRFPLAYEREALAAEKLEAAGGGPKSADATADLFTFCLYSLVGFGPSALRERMEFDDRALLYYAAHFAQRPRSASALEDLVADYFRVPTAIRQFHGQWLYLSVDDQTRLSACEPPEGLNCRLGVDAIVGERVWGMESKFRVRLGPVGYEQFLKFTPMGESLKTLGQWVRTFVGAEYDFDVQVVLKAQEVPPCQLPSRETDGESSAPPRLGWNTWLQSVPRTRDAADAVFVQEGEPSR